MMTKLERDNNNMKVAVRLRAHQQTNQSDCIQVNETNIFLNNSEHYKYDYVFDELSTQSMIYNQAISELESKCFDGFNVTLFAYGQSGSGKTYTLGSSGNPDMNFDDNEGIIPRTVRNMMKRNDGNTSIKISLIEVYKDKIFDLLDIEKKKMYNPKLPG